MFFIKKILFFISLFVVFTVSGQQRFHVPTIDQLNAFEKIMSLPLVDLDPEFFSINEQRAIKKKELIRLLEKKGKSLTPSEQIDLLKSTLDFKALDSFSAQLFYCFIASFGLQALEHIITSYLAQKNGGNTYQTDEVSIFAQAKKNLSRSDESEAIKSQDHEEKTSFSALSEVFTALRDDILSALGYSLDEPALKKLPLESDTAEKLDLSKKPNDNNDDIARQAFIGTLSSRPICWYIQKVVTYKRIKELMAFKHYGLNLGIKLYPFYSRIFSLIRFHNAKLKGNTFEQYFELVLKEISKKTREVIGETSPQFEFLKKIFSQLWDKHSGNSKKIWEEIDSISRILQDHADAQNRFTSYVGAMKFQVNVSADNQQTFIKALSRGIESGIFKRFLLTCGIFGLVVLISEFSRLIKKEYLSEYLKLKELKYNPRLVFWGFFMLDTLRGCYNNVSTYKNVEAERDFNVFISRLTIPRDILSSKFYWSWFLPMWRIKNKDLLAVESAFLSYVDHFSYVAAATVTT
jgi:hypothetical protein